MHIKQSKEWGSYLKYLGWESLYLPQAIRIKKLGPYSLIKIQRPKRVTQKFLEKLDDIAKGKNALFIKIEPDNPVNIQILQSFGYTKDKTPLSPTKTVLMDLTFSLDEIFKKFSKDTRQRVRKFTRPHRLTAQRLAGGAILHKRITDETALKDFYSLFKQTAKIRGFWVPPIKEIKAKSQAFKDNGFIIIAYEKDKTAATAYILIKEKTAYYEHAAHNPKIAGDSPYQVLWQVILECKKLKLEKLDLCGIYDERFKKQTGGWKNFTIFKNKWGGKEVEYCSPYIKYFNLLARFFRL